MQNLMKRPQSAFKTDGSCDPKIIELVQCLARQAAEEDFAALNDATNHETSIPVPQCE